MAAVASRSARSKLGIAHWAVVENHHLWLKAANLAEIDPEAVKF
jgi:hypothetical protein